MVVFKFIQIIGADMSSAGGILEGNALLFAGLAQFSANRLLLGLIHRVDYKVFL